MNKVSCDSAIEKMNFYGKSGIPFFFIIDFEMEKPVVLPLDEIDNDKIIFDMNGIRNFDISAGSICSHVDIKKMPMPFEAYLEPFSYVQDCQRNGDSWLVNLTSPTEITMNAGLREVFF